jgi:O-antigen chain-terminating methyltransferase
MTDGFYRAFEDRYRGSRELIKSRLRVYLPFVEPLRAAYAECTALDLGCGRGEWLELMREIGVEARGVDLDDGMLAACSERGLAAEHAEAIAFLRGLPDESVVIVSAFHVAEHIPFADLQTLVQEALRVLRPAGLLILETPNPENLEVATVKFYYDPTHQRPLPPALLSFLPEHYGFARTKVLRLQEPAGLADATTVSLKNVLTDVSPDFAVVAQKAGSTATQLAPLDEAFERRFGVGLETLAVRYEEGMGAKLAEILVKVDRSLELEARAQSAELELARARQREDEREAEIERLGAAIAQAQEQAAAREAEVERLGAAIAQAQEQAAAREAEIERLNARVQALVASASWRITAPLRVVGGAGIAAARAPHRLTRWFVERLDALISHPIPSTIIRRTGRWILGRPRIARALSALLRRYPRLLGRLTSIVLFPVPAATGPGTARGEEHAVGATAAATGRVRGVLTGTDNDIDELMHRIEDEVSQWRARGG